MEYWFSEGPTLSPEQETYDTVGPPKTHRVEKDINRTLSRVYGEIDGVRRRFGYDAIIILTMTVHVPSKLLPQRSEGTHENDATG
jgi:hypothetical protein